MMTGRARWLTLLACCAVVAVSAPIGASATGQARSTAVTANRHAGHQIAALTRCAVRNKAMGTARISGFLGDTQNLNPYQSNPLAGLFESYFVSNNKLKMIPVMASEVPTPKNGGVRDGGKTVVLHLKMGLRWSNGVEITAADARFGWRIDTDKVTGPACGGPCREIRTVQTPGKYTIIYRLKHVTPSFLTDGLPSIWPTRWTGAWKDDPHAAAIKLGTDPTFNFKGPNYPTNGPYQVARVVEGKEVILKPMKYYSTMTCGGSIATLVAEVEGSVARTIAALVAGHLDLWDEAGIIPLPELERHSEYTIHIDPQFALEHLAFNVDPTVNGAANPLHDARVRLALALALDKRLLIRTVLPFSARQARGILAWTPWINTPKLVQQYADTTIRGQWDPIAKAYVSDTGQGKALADARKLLASTRWKKGFTIDLHTSDIGRRRATVPVLTAAWARIGVTVNATIQGAELSSAHGITVASWHTVPSRWLSFQLLARPA